MKVDCIKCGGHGFVGGCDHIWNGRCFMCGGAGKVESKPGDVVASAPTMRQWHAAAWTVTELVGRFEVVSTQTGAIVLAWADGYAVACDSVKNKPAAEAWASKLLLSLLAA